MSPRLAVLCLVFALPACRQTSADFLVGLSSDDPYVRRLSVVGLGQAETPNPEVTVHRLLAATPHDNDPLRETADASLTAIAARHPGVFVQRLARQTELHDDRIVRILSSNPSASTPALAHALLDNREFDRTSIARLLGELGAHGPLLEFAARSCLATAIAIGGLERGGEPLRPHVSRLAENLLDEPDERAIRRACAFSPTAAWVMLQRLRPGERGERAVVLGSLQSAAREDELGAVSAMILGSCMPRAEPHILDVLTDPRENETHTAAASALGTLGAEGLRKMLERDVDASWIVIAAQRDVDASRATLEDAAQTGDDRVRALARDVLERL